jgi:hypothetical protein
MNDDLFADGAIAINTLAGTNSIASRQNDNLSHMSLSYKDGSGGGGFVTRSDIAKSLVSVLSAKKEDLPMLMNDEDEIVKEIAKARLSGDIRLQGD